MAKVAAPERFERLELTGTIRSIRESSVICEVAVPLLRVLGVTRSAYETDIRTDLIRILSKLLLEEEVCSSASKDEENKENKESTEHLLLAGAPIDAILDPEPVPDLCPGRNVCQKSNRVDGAEDADGCHGEADEDVLRAGYGKEGHYEANRSEYGDED